MLYVMGGAVALLFSFLITLEKAKLAVDPSYIPPCNVNPFISCGTVMLTPQASAFGFPNSLIGIAGFAALITIGVVLLVGTRLPRWFWLALQAGTTFAVAFIFWLFFQSVYRIGTLCPYCMVVWAMTIPVFWYTTLHNLQEGHVRLSEGLSSLLCRFHAWFLALLYLLIVAAIGVHFWSYWQTFL